MSLELDFAAMRVGVRNVRGDILMVSEWEFTSMSWHHKTTEICP